MDGEPSPTSAVDDTVLKRHALLLLDIIAFARNVQYMCDQDVVPLVSELIQNSCCTNEDGALELDTLTGMHASVRFL